MISCRLKTDIAFFSNLTCIALKVKIYTITYMFHSINASSQALYHFYALKNTLVDRIKVKNIFCLILSVFYETKTP